MNPYRAPREPEPPPVDAMRTVLFVAGGIAALLVIAAVVVSIIDGSRHRILTAGAAPNPVPTPTVADTQTETEEVTAAPVAPGSNSAQLPPPAPPKDTVSSDAPLAFEAETTPCFGNCDSHTTTIAADGNVTVLHGYSPCRVAPGFRVSAAERAALTSEARALHLDKEFTNYVYMTDVQRLVVRIKSGLKEWEVDYLPGSNPYARSLPAADQRAVAAAAAFYDHIERAAATARWLSACGGKH